jgi:hypothetical protein
MLFWAIQVTLISIILIFLVHHLLVFFKTNLTTPKIKDLVNAPTQKYDAIFNAMIFNEMNTSSANSANINNISLEELLPPIQPDPVDMKNELKQFMKKQFKENTNNPSNSTINLDSFNSSSSSSTMQYSNY